MSTSAQQTHPVWTNRWTYILATTGAAVGLGNIWKFPYIAGENGGGAFVLIYLICIFCLFSSNYPQPNTLKYPDTNC